MSNIKLKTAMSMAETAKVSATIAGSGNVKAFFDAQRGALAAVLPRHITPDRMLRLALGALRNTPKLGAAKVETLFGAIIQCAQLGLEPNTPLGQAYLIPFDNHNTKQTEVQVVFGYKGLIDLARRSGRIISIAAHEVCENDFFEFQYGLKEELVHRPALVNRGEIIAFYAVAILSDGGHAFEVMSAHDVNAIRDASHNYRFARDKSATVWGQHYASMGRKTVIRRLCKYLPVSIELATAIEIDEKADVGITQDFDVLPAADTTASVPAPALPEPQAADTSANLAEELTL